MQKAIRHFNDAKFIRQPRTDIDQFKFSILLDLYEIFTHPDW